ncbi:MAG: DUF362 domain-containing protein [Candidatus Thermoplasmatota archaeon]|nr:DUF362 domain-containing protein [Candidatus Thermoplasmatota archaeon]
MIESDRPMVHIERAKEERGLPALRSTMEALDWTRNIRANSRVAIKPNGCHIRYLPGLITTPHLLGELVRIVKTRASEVIVVESDLQRFNAMDVFEGTGYLEEVEKADGRCSNLTEEEQIKVKVPGGQMWKERTMPRSLVECDHFISMPVMKTHKLWLVSLGIKNQFGNVPESDRVKYQKYLPQVVGDFNAYRPADLVIADGLIGLEADGPIAGIPKRLDLIVGGTNLVATDAVMCNIMGFDPLASGLIKNMYERRLGPIELDRIDLSGLPLDKARSKFRGPSQDIISKMERQVRRHPKLSNFIYRSWFFTFAKRTAWAVRSISGYKGGYESEVERTGLWKDYDWKSLMEVYTPIA